MAVFGSETKDTFMKLHRARNTKGPTVKEPERTKKLVQEFQSDIERICGPFVNRKFDRSRTKTLSQL
jgi:hypothetical protein